MRGNRSIDFSMASVVSVFAILLIMPGYRGPSGLTGAYACPPPQSTIPTVTVIVTSGVDGEPMPARCSITDVVGTDRFPPPGSSFYHDVEEGYFYTSGIFELGIPEGMTVIRVGRGFEFVPVELAIDISSDTTLTIALERVCDAAATGTFSGDVHLHIDHGSGYYTLEPEDARAIALAEGLSVMNCLDNDYFFTGGPDDCSDSECIVYMSEERRSGVWGHYGLLGLNHLIEPVGNAWGELLAEVCDSVHAQPGAVVVAAHPLSSDDYFDIVNWPGSGLAREFPVDAALGKIDAFEIMSYSNRGDGIEIDPWYDMLNCDLKIPAAGGTDALLNHISQYPAGGFRTYVYTGDPALSFEKWTDGIMKGRTFVTNGPLFQKFLVLGSHPGRTLHVYKDEYLFPIEIELWSAYPLERVEIIRNGRVAKTLYPNPGHCAIDTLVNIRVSDSSWIAARAYGSAENWFTKGDTLFAHTSPYYVDMVGVPNIEHSPAERLAEWLEDLLLIVRGRDDWPSPEDSIMADDYVSLGVEFYRDIAGEAVSADPTPAPATLHCYPNPFNATLIISLTAFRGDDRGVAESLVIYDIAGRKIRDLTSQLARRTATDMVWNGMNEKGQPAASGVYFVKLIAGRAEYVQKVVLLR